MESTSIDAGRESMARLPSACVWQIWRFFLDFLPIVFVDAQCAVLVACLWGPGLCAVPRFVRLVQILRTTDGDPCRSNAAVDEPLWRASRSFYGASVKTLLQLQQLPPSRASCIP